MLFFVRSLEPKLKLIVYVCVLHPYGYVVFSFGEVSEESIQYTEYKLMFYPKLNPVYIQVYQPRKLYKLTFSQKSTRCICSCKYILDFKSSWFALVTEVEPAAQISNFGSHVVIGIDDCTTFQADNFGDPVTSLPCNSSLRLQSSLPVRCNGTTTNHQNTSTRTLGGIRSNCHRQRETPAQCSST